MSPSCALGHGRWLTIAVLGTLTPVRLLVLGESDSSGQMLRAEDLPRTWPRLVAAELAPLIGGEPVELLSTILKPLAGGEIDRLIALLDDFDPDLVTVSSIHWPFTVMTVKSRVRQRWGMRGLRFAKRVEATFERVTPAGRIGTPVNKFGRSLAKLAVGTATISTYDEVMGAYETIYAHLSRRESTHVVVLGGSRLSPFMETPRIRRLIDRFDGDMRALTARRRFVWFDAEAPVAGPDRESCFIRDGAHKNTLGHRRTTDLLLPVLAAAVNRDRWVDVSS